MVILVARIAQWVVGAGATRFGLGRAGSLRPRTPDESAEQPREFPRISLEVTTASRWMLGPSALTPTINRSASIPTMSPINKDQFVSVLNAAGITDDQKHRLHAAFEKQLPQGHQAFLEWLGLPAETVRQIREQSRS